MCRGAQPPLLLGFFKFCGRQHRGFLVGRLQLSLIRADVHSLLQSNSVRISRAAAWISMRVGERQSHYKRVCQQDTLRTLQGRQKSSQSRMLGELEEFSYG